MSRRITCLIGVVNLMLLGSLGSGAVAQDQQGTATHVSGRSPGGIVVSEGTQDDGVYGVRGAVYEHVIEWSDSRLPAVMQVAENVDWHQTSDSTGAAITVVSSVRLQGSEGAWMGLEYGLIEEPASDGPVTRLMVLEGEGVYEGLSAMLRRTYEDADYAKPVFDGYIFDGGMTPMPDALEVFDEAAEFIPEQTAAPEPSPAPAGEMTFVSGTESCGARTPAIEVAADGSWDAQGSVATCHNDMSDPRVSGAWTNTLNASCFGKDLCLIWGTAVLEGPDGGWACSWAGSNYPVGERQYGYWPILLHAVCPGTGAYDELTYDFQHASSDFTDGSSFNGVIYEGLPPSVE